VNNYSQLAFHFSPKRLWTHLSKTKSSGHSLPALILGEALAMNKEATGMNKKKGVKQQQQREMRDF